MPQPLSGFAPNSGYTLASGDVSISPEMASAVVAVINFWAQIEHSYTTLLATIAKADPVTIVAAHLAVQSIEARRAALFAAAESALSVEDYSLIQAVVESCKTSRDDRNTFAHHLWGNLSDRDDCVILVNPKYAARYFSSVLESVTDRRRRQIPDLDRSKVMVWRLSDFQEAKQRAGLCHDRTMQLPFAIESHPAAVRRRPALLEDQQIARLYSRYLQQNNASQRR